MRVLIGTLLALLSACGTVSEEITFQGGTDEAYVLVVGEGMGSGAVETNSITFREAIVADQRFTRQHVSVTFGGLAGREFTTPEGMPTGIRFAGRSTRAGDFFLLSYTRTTTYGMSTNSIQTCYAEGSVIYRFQAGAINIVPHGRLAAVNRTQLSAMVDQVLAGYPNMTAPRVFAQPVGIATFESGQWLGQPSCVAEGGAFSFTPAPALPNQ